MTIDNDGISKPRMRGDEANVIVPAVIVKLLIQLARTKLNAATEHDVTREVLNDLEQRAERAIVRDEKRITRLTRRRNAERPHASNETAIE